MTSLVLPYGPHWGPLGRMADVSTVETSALVRLRVRVDEAVRRQTILVVTGRFGVGKSYALARAVEERAPVHGVEVVWLEMRDTRSEKDQWRELHKQIVGEYPAASASIGDIVRILKDVLAERDRLLVLDEAQEVKPIVMKQLRWLHEPEASKFGLVFSGTPTLWNDLLPGEVRSRTGHHVKVTGLGDDDAAALLPGFHPIFDDADEADLRFWNQTRAKGSFRWWARVLANAIDQLPHLPSGRLDRETIVPITVDIPEGNR